MLRKEVTMRSKRDERTLQLLHRLPLALDRVLQVADRQVSCTAAQLSALGVIIYLKATTLSALAAKEGVSAPTASRIVDSLVRDGLVERLADPEDRRAVRLSASKKGQAAVVDACNHRADVLREKLAGLSEEEWAALSISAKALNRVFGYDQALQETDGLKAEADRVHA
ncbi:MAG: MarR family transcriptional regulator [Nitratireductor sp.]|nr:MarR family transcriptional regulator [Nitratireductor sp.]